MTAAAPIQHPNSRSRRKQRSRPIPIIKRCPLPTQPPNSYPPSPPPHHPSYLLPSNFLITPIPPPPSPKHIHHRGTLIHLSIIHRPAPQHRSARLPPPKHRRRITPKVLTVRDTPPTERVAPLPPLPRGTTHRRRAPPPCRLNESIHPQQPAPMLKDPPMAMAMPVSMAVAVSPTLCTTSGGSGTGIERRAGGGERAGEGGRGAGVDAEHVLVGGHCAGDLDELHEEQHGHPGELEGGPKGKEEAVGVGVDDAAEGGGEDVAFGGGGGREGCEIWWGG